MAQITVTVELNEKNLEILKQLCPVESTDKAPKKTTRKPKNSADESASEAAAPAMPPTAFCKADDIPCSPHSPEQPAPKSQPEQPAVTQQDVYAVALRLSKAGKQKLLADAFAKFGGKKLSDIKEADYPALLKILNAGGEENA